MRISEKGQVTIPKDLRDALGLGSGSEVEFSRDGSVLLVRKVSDREAGRGRALVSRLRGRGDVIMTTEEIMALTRSDD